MAGKLHHEIIYRGKDDIDKLSKARLIVCGAGALGSNLVAHLARQGFKNMTVIDRDRVEEQNIGTQVYSVDDIGGLKAEILRNLIYREVGEDIEAIPKELTAKNASKFLNGFDAVIDSFDNSISRRVITEHCKEANIPCLHIGVNGDYGELRWNEKYIIPSDAGDDICDYPLARNLIYLVTAVAGELLIRFILDGNKENYSITLGDLRINRDE
ncbi:MAG: ThiF family adenylyltransferase [Candidatus Melainabacteria bacterium]|nr:ThiF family adenylyltransferase [Candidatus Melainabacteria bacterium]